MTDQPTDAFIKKDLLDRLLKEGAVRSFAPDSVIIEEHDYIKNVPIVLSGSIKVFKLDEDGKEILLYYIKPGESCVMSFLGAACKGTSKIRAVVEEQAEVLILPVYKAIDLIKDNPWNIDFRAFELVFILVNSIPLIPIILRHKYSYPKWNIKGKNW